MNASELYRELILDHSRHPHHYGGMPDASVRVDGRNAMCGDHLCLYLKMRQGKVENVAFEGTGCAICMASASMMTDAVAGKSEAEVLALSDHVDAMLTDDGLPPTLGKLEALSGVRQFPSRIKCAALAWNTLREGIRQYHVHAQSDEESLQ